MEDPGFTIQDGLDVLKRRWTALIIPFLLVASAATLTALLLPAVYRSTATILIEQREIPAEYVTSSITTYAEQRIQSIQQRILTADRLLKLIEKFDLYTELSDKKTTDEIVKQMRQDIRLTPVNVEIADRRSGRTATATIAFTLSYDGRSPEKVQQVADTITSLFLKEDLKVRREQASSAYDFLEREKERLQDRIRDLEKDLAAFKRENVDALPELFQLNRRTLDTIENQINRAWESLRTSREKKEELDEQLVNTPVFLEDTDSEKARKNQDEKRLQVLEMELINLKTKFSDIYPDVKKLKQEIRDLRKKVAENRETEEAKRKNPAYITLSARSAGLASDIRSVQNQIADLEAQATGFRDRLSMTPGVEETYNALKTERNSLYAKYNELQAKMMEARVAREFESEQKGERFTLVEAARLPEKPFKPNRPVIAAIGLILGMGAGAVLAALLEMSDTAYRSGEALARASGLPVLAEIPVIVTKQDKKKAGVKKWAVILGAFSCLMFAALAFHFFVMDFAVLQAKLMRKYF